MNDVLHEMIKRPHPALVHFPMALYPASTLFLLLFFGLDTDAFLMTSFWCFMIAAVSIFPVALTGMLDYMRLGPHSKKANRLLNLHLFNGVLVTLFGLATGVYFWISPPMNHDVMTSYAVCNFVITGLVLVQGIVAAMMVYQHKLGIDGETR